MSNSNALEGVVNKLKEDENFVITKFKINDES
jgi:hypothetical protein